MKPLSLVQDRPLIWAHRGGRSLAAENTLQALRKAHKAGADGWETDVQMTKDGELILLHDLNLLRTTNASVHPLFKDRGLVLPWRFPLKEIKQLSAGVFPRRQCSRHSFDCRLMGSSSLPSLDIQVPTLAEALDLTAELGMWINIEIKDITRVAPTELSKNIVKKIISLVQSKEMDTQVIISSFNHDLIRNSKELAPGILTGALTPHSFKGDPLETVRAAKADAWHPGYRFLTHEAIRKTRKAGLAITPYTVNALEDMTRLAKWGVTGLVTDCPQDVL